MGRAAATALALALLLLAPAAHASPRMESLLQDDELLLYSPPAQVDATLDELAALGVDRVRLSALWAYFAPDAPPARPRDPAAYAPAAFAGLDHVIRAAGERGIAVLLNPRGGAPAWAHARGGGDAFRPDARAFGAFVEMLGRRYSGAYVPDGAAAPLPRVGAWSVWNEPNWRSLLQPQSVGRRPVAPRLYRRLYRAATRGLARSGHGDDITLLGETAPLGDRARGPERSLYPGVFYRALFCLDRDLQPRRGCGGFGPPLRATGVAHHPYPVLAPPEFRSIGPDEIRLGDTRRLTRILDAAHRHGRLTVRRAPIWHTEFGYQTDPPDPYRGVSPRRQARWAMRGEHLAFRDPRVVGFTQFLLQDTPGQVQYGARDRRRWSTYQTGLKFADGRLKPAYVAYRMPFVALGGGRFWGQVRPAPAGSRPRVVFQRRADGRWRPERARVVRNPRGFYTVRLGPGRHRAVWSGRRSRPAG